MAWTRSAYPCLKPRGQQLTKKWKEIKLYAFVPTFPRLQTLTAEGRSQLFQM